MLLRAVPDKLFLQLPYKAWQAPDVTRSLSVASRLYTISTFLSPPRRLTYIAIPMLPPSHKNESPPTHRKVPMHVLALGFSRTGTASLKLALETLGYVRTNHGFSVALASHAELDMWIEAIRAKFYGEGKPYTRAEWDRLLGDCQAVTDTPHILFAEELVAAYPDAKVVLTTRSPDIWWKSYEATIAEELKPSLRVRLNSWLYPQYGKNQYLLRLVYSTLFNADFVTEEVAKARFTAHYEQVRRLVPKEKLLEFEVKEGWAPLVAFLGKEAPNIVFPKVNDRKQFHKAVYSRRYAVRLWPLVGKIGSPVLALVAAALFWYILCKS